MVKSAREWGVSDDGNVPGAADLGAIVIVVGLKGVVEWWWCVWEVSGEDDEREGNDKW